MFGIMCTIGEDWWTKSFREQRDNQRSEPLYLKREVEIGWYRVTRVKLEVVACSSKTV